MDTHWIVETDACSWAVSVCRETLTIVVSNTTAMTPTTSTRPVRRTSRSGSGAEPDAVVGSGPVVATGGFLCHYNPPYGDIFMEVTEPARRQGIGSYLVQEVKRVCYEAGKKPAARCGPSNIASRRTLQKAGLLPCGRLLAGKIRK